jgi:hypothetical protein
MPKTLIVGIARSGTSALYFKLREALPPTTWCLFEPREIDPSELVHRRKCGLFSPVP